MASHEIIRYSDTREEADKIAADLLDKYGGFPAEGQVSISEGWAYRDAFGYDHFYEPSYFEFCRVPVPDDPRCFRVRCDHWGFN